MLLSKNMRVNFDTMLKICTFELIFWRKEESRKCVRDTDYSLLIMITKRCLFHVLILLH